MRVGNQRLSILGQDDTVNILISGIPGINLDFLQLIGTRKAVRLLRGSKILDRSRDVYTGKIGCKLESIDSDTVHVIGDAEVRSSLCYRIRLQVLTFGAVLIKDTIGSTIFCIACLDLDFRQIRHLGKSTVADVICSLRNRDTGDIGLCKDIGADAFDGVRKHDRSGTGYRAGVPDA